ncbi:MAG: ChaN family lipoprotein [Deltaproteobacteria bacterium]|nr:ChaN family lipoprotein [Deltaproteobacteria bacterium]
MRVTRSIFNVLLVAMVLAAFGCAHRIVRVSDNTEVPLEEFVERIKGVAVVFAGELHDKKSHHKLQLDIIRALNEAGEDVAVGVEMFPKDKQPDLDRWIYGSMGEDEFREVYAENWKIPWPKYRDIFLYAKEQRLPVVALNVPRSLIHQVFTKGIGSLTEEQLAELPPDVKCDVDSEYEEFIKEAMGEHEEMGEEAFNKFCEAQMVWDAAMAKSVIDYMEKNPGKKMVVLAGSGHSWKRGIPGQMERLSGLDYLVILPDVSDFDSFSVTTKDADYIWTGWFY